MWSLIKKLSGSLGKTVPIYKLEMNNIPSPHNFLPEWEALSVLETEDTVVVYSANNHGLRLGLRLGRSASSITT